MRKIQWIVFAVMTAAATAPAYATEYFVGLSGNDANPGTEKDKPFRTIAKGLSVLQPGDILSLRQGVYVGAIDINGTHGTAAQRITIRSAPGESAYLDGSLAPFRTPNQADWVPAQSLDPTAPADEYISTHTITDFPRGVFLDRNPYTRLLTYSDLQDLRATNETWTKITSPATDARCGQSGNGAPRCEDVVGQCAATDTSCPIVFEGKRYRLAGYTYPHVYMGPGIWVDPTVSATNPKPIHIRLAPTHNHIAGLADYTGATDPRQLKLAISPKIMITLLIRNSSFLDITDLAVRFGGEYTMHVTSTTSLGLHRLRVLAGSVAMRSNSNTGMVIRDSIFDGGLPTWQFRSDKKDEYDYVTTTGTVAHNNLTGQTVIGILRPGAADAGAEIAYNEFINSHDLYVSINGLKMHHNWIANLNDESMVLDDVPVGNVDIYQNVITKTLSTISFAGGAPGGRISIYRNLIDLRAPTAGYRPQFVGDTGVWRYGSLLKSNTTPAQPFDGPYDLFQNTILVYDQRDAQALYGHYRDGGIAPGGTNRRRSLNNVFFAVNPSPDPIYDAITFVPSPSFPAETDGNSYFRLGNATTKPFRYAAYPGCGGTCPGGYFANLAELRSSALFTASKAQYPPGYEARSIETNPRFVRIGGDGLARSTDDLRLASDSPARNAGVPLAAALRALDPLAPAAGISPEIGAYPFGGAPLAVGVGGLRRFPQ